MEMPIRIGIHGSRNTGKTCYYAALYGSQADGETAVFLATEETVGELERHWKMLERGQKPEATAMTEQKELDLSVHCAGMKSDVAARDYSGAVVQRGKKDVPKLTEDVSKWLRESEALFILIDASRISHLSEEDLREQQIEIGLLISRLHRWRKLAKPMALVLTKWDLTADKLLSPEEEATRAAAFVEEHKLLGEIATGVKLSGTDFEIFPVSAFGGHRADDSTLPPEGGVRPFNVVNPLAWCVERVRAIRAARRKRRFKALVMLAAILLAASCWGLDRHATRLFDTAIRQMNDISAPTSEVNMLIKQYSAHWNPMTRLYGRKTRFEEARQSFHTQRETYEYEILSVPDPSMSSGDLKILITSYSNYLKNWSIHEADVGQMRRTAESYLPSVLDREVFNGKVADLFNQLGGIPDAAKRLEALNSFMAENPESKLSPDCKEAYDRAKTERDRAVAELKDAEWKSIMKFCNDYAGRYKDCVDHIDRYLGASPDPDYVRLAQDKKREIETLWDRQNYENARGALQSARKMKTQKGGASTPPDGVYDAIKKYAEQASPQPGMRDEAEAWLEWYESFKNGRSVSVLIERLIIAKDGKLDEILDKKINIAIHIRGRGNWTDTYKGKSRDIRFNQARLAPFEYRLGDAISVMVTEYDKTDPDDVVESALHPLGRELELKYGKDFAGTLYLHFDGQPELLDYNPKQ